jgi:hypothetical protein
MTSGGLLVSAAPGGGAPGIAIGRVRAAAEDPKVFVSA